MEEESRTDRIPSAEDSSAGRIGTDGDSDDVTDEDSLDATTVIRYVSEVATLMGVLSYIVLQQGDEIKNQGLPAFLKQLVIEFE